MNPIKLSANESHHGPSPLAAEAYRRCATSCSATRTARRSSCAARSPRRSGCASQGIVCGNGSDELLQLLIRAYVRPGDDVVLSRHCFAMAYVHATAQGARHRARRGAAAAAGYRQPAGGHDAADTRIVIIASPNNPVGHYLPRAELWRLRRGLPAETVLIIDAAYADYVVAEDFEPGRSLVEAGSNTVMTRTFSKLYGLAGLRIGWMYGPANIVDAVTAHPHAVQCIGGRDGGGGRRGPRRALQRSSSATTITTSCERIAGAVSSPWAQASSSCRAIANFYLLRFIDGRHTPEGAAAALERSGIIPRPVAAGGPPDCLRITVGLQSRERCRAAGTGRIHGALSRQIAQHSSMAKLHPVSDADSSTFSRAHGRF